MNAIILSLLISIGATLPAGAINHNLQEIKIGQYSDNIEIVNSNIETYKDESIYQDEETSGNSSSNGSLIVFSLLFLIILPLFWKPSRKAIGLFNIITGTILCLTGAGILIGLPMILFGALLFFI